VSDERVDASLSRLPGVDLAHLDAVARLQTRRDRKYLLPVADTVRVLELLADSACVLTIADMRSFRYRSVYLDTPDLSSYLAAARGRPRRWKVRVRSYVDTGGSVLEVKRRDRRGRTVKVRRLNPAGLGDCLDDAARVFIAGCPEIGDQASRLRPVLETKYRRSTLLLPQGDRVTIDLGLCATAVDTSTVGLVGMAVVETKSQGSACSADRVLWSLGHRQVRVSKYGTSLAALFPDLPSNRWTRALQRPWMVAGIAAERRTVRGFALPALIGGFVLEQQAAG
jgi:hypothetical protein